MRTVIVSEGRAACANAAVEHINDAITARTQMRIILSP
ncbi:hypothetical protein MGWOODY_Smn2109 [hydrothermal vent metagenome]|uniref:Uncharacterized protein n=1 Tax=hydrothermal vent metagenome TaxID=652676 RepID=A0A160TRE6_9ZZZZ